jgi:hypothetical protein
LVFANIRWKMLWKTIGQLLGTAERVRKPVRNAKGNWIASKQFLQDIGKLVRNAKLRLIPAGKMFLLAGCDIKKIREMRPSAKKRRGRIAQWQLAKWPIPFLWSTTFCLYLLKVKEAVRNLYQPSADRLLFPLLPTTTFSQTQTGATVPLITW